MTLLRCFVVWTLPVSLMVMGARMASGQAPSPGSGQDYPNKPIRIMTAEPGGGPNLISRTIAPGMSGSLDQQVIVDNRGLIAIETVAKAAPDRYTLLVYGSSIWDNGSVSGIIYPQHSQ